MSIHYLFKHLSLTFFYYFYFFLWQNFAIAPQNTIQFQINDYKSISKSNYINLLSY